MLTFLFSSEDYLGELVLRGYGLVLLGGWSEVELNFCYECHKANLKSKGQKSQSPINSELLFKSSISTRRRGLRQSFQPFGRAEGEAWGNLSNHLEDPLVRHLFVSLVSLRTISLLKPNSGQFQHVCCVTRSFTETPTVYNTDHLKVIICALDSSQRLECEVLKRAVDNFFYCNQIIS